MMTRKWVAFLAVAAVIALVFWLLSPDQPAPEKHAVSGNRGVRPPVRQPDRPLPGWAVAPRQRRIAGRVLHGDRPVTGARVALSSTFTDARGTILDEVITDHEGRFDLGMRGEHSHWVLASATGLTSATSHVDLRDPTRDPERIELRLDDCEVEVTGTIRDRDGGPVVHGTVGLGRPSQDAVDGRFALCAHGGDKVDVRADGYARAVLEVPRAPRAFLDVALEPESVIGGMVRDQAGLPVPDAYVSAGSVSSPSFGNYHHTVSDRDGRYELRGLAAGFYRLNAFGGDDGVLLLSPMIKVAAGDTVSADLMLSATTTVSGRVVDASGRPVAGVPVRLVNVLLFAGSRVSRSDAQGLFTATHVPYGAMRIFAGGWIVTVPDHVDVPATGLTDVTVRVASRAGITGTVSYRGSHVVGAEVRALSGRTVRKRVTTAADGSFSVAVDELQGVRLQARAGNLVSQITWVEVPRAATENVTVSLELVEGQSITGQVVDQTGSVLPGVTVALEPAHEPLHLSATTDDSGRFAFGPLVSGEYDVTVRDRQTGAAYAVLRPERARFTSGSGPLTVIVDTSAARH
jgi:hypothetical protein